MNRTLIGGLAALVVSAVLALVTGRASAAFLPGILLNGAYGAAMLVSLLAGWPLIGVLVGALLREGSLWRSDPVKRRLFTWLTVLWLGLFAVRLLVEVPLYLALGEATTVRLAWVLRRRRTRMIDAGRPAGGAPGAMRRS